jgi:hypothetical protein
MIKNKKTKVTRKFLLDLADRIYNPKTKKFLRLCNGTLQNGPDPTDKKRSMHCGLGELYFAVTGLQPEDHHVDEDDVVDIVSYCSTLCNDDLKDFETAKASIRSLNIDDADILHSLHAKLMHRLLENKKAKKLVKFRNLLNVIPNINDGAECVGLCDDDLYIERSKQVAKQLRLAAKVLPA